jgi:hypothetical protein
MQGRKFQLKTNICAKFQENTGYQESRAVLVLYGTTFICLFITSQPHFTNQRAPMWHHRQTCFYCCVTWSNVALNYPDCCNCSAVDCSGGIQTEYQPGRAASKGGGGGGWLPGCGPPKSKFKGHRFCKRCGIKSFTWFTRQLKSATEAGWRLYIGILEKWNKINLGHVKC